MFWAVLPDSREEAISIKEIPRACANRQLRKHPRRMEKYNTYQSIILKS